MGYLEKNPQEPVEWGWANPAGGMFASPVDIAKVTLKSVITRLTLFSFENSLNNADG